MLGSFYKPSQTVSPSQSAVVLTNDGRGTFKIIHGSEPVVVSGRSRDTDLHGGARYDDRGGGAALYRWWPVGYGR